MQGTDVMQKEINYTGKKEYEEGSFVGTAQVLSKKKVGRYWIYSMKCHCGKTFTMRKDSIKRCLMRGYSPTCGCVRAAESYVGQKRGRLLVKREIIGKRPRQYECLCDCGNTIIRTHASLSAGTSSCGCATLKTQKEYKQIHIGDTFGDLLVREIVSTRPEVYLCECLCGQHVQVRGKDLRLGRKKNCGNHKPISKWRGYGEEEKEERLHKIWYGMLYRCFNPQSQKYTLYGGRGIGICNDWLKEPNKFVEWSLASGYEIGLSIDRIDNNKGYSPDNCRWIMREKQSGNRRTNAVFFYNGERLTAAEASRRTGLKYSTILKRIRSGWDPESILTLPISNLPLRTRVKNNLKGYARNRLSNITKGKETT